MRRTNRRRATIASAAAAGLALCAPTVGSAAVTIGGDVSAPVGLPTACDPSSPQPCELAQITIAGGQTAAPFSGVVVRWRIAGSTGPFALRVVRPAGSDFTFVSSSAPETATGSGVDTFATRQPIRAGDYVGIEEGSTAKVGVSDTGTTRDSVAIWRFTPDGQTAPPLAFVPNASIPYNADLEPDADHDGYGDETQDQCPTDASTQGACPPRAPAPAPTPAASAPVADTTPPVLRASTRHAKLTKRGAISVFVTCSENAAGLATGSIRARTTVHFAKRDVHLIAGRRTKVTLRLSRRSAALVARVLATHARVTASIALSVADTAGNRSVMKLSVKLRR